jgi:ABC-2 type transport system permease protein
MGDFVYGFISYGLSGYFSWDGLARYVLATLLAATVFAAFLILTQSLAFWFGMMTNFSNLVLNAMLTFGIYPITLFDSYAKLILFTLIPAALMGAIPAEFIRAFSWGTLGQLLAGAVGFLTLAIFIFNTGLRRYESGSAIQVEV